MKIKLARLAARRACALVVLSLGVIMALPGCDPCAGVATCTTQPRLVVEGNLVVQYNGSPTAGVRLDLIRRGGVSLATDSSSTTTDRNGHWQFAVAASGSGEVEVDIAVTPPAPYPPYRVTGLSLATTTASGEGQILPTWVVNPYFAYAGELYSRADQTTRVSGATVQFQQTGGAPIYGFLSGGMYQTTSDPAGRFSMFGIYVSADGLGPMTGNFTVNSPNSSIPDTIVGITLTPTYLLDTATQVVRFGVGPSLLYVGELFNRGNNQRIAGVQVTFQQTGGSAATPQSFSAVTDGTGRFSFPLEPLAEGTVVGNLAVTPPAPASPFTITGLQLPTFHADGGRLLGVWGWGPDLPWDALIQLDGVGIQGVQVDFQRTGGIAVTPSAYTTTTNASGYAFLNPDPLGLGNVIADVTIHSPPPYATFTVHNVTLPTLQQDGGGGVLYSWDVTAPPAGSTILQARRPPVRPPR
jgi:hypothetical protein